ncbi:MAG: flavodoxin family protein [Methanomicrobiales archaeon]|nr:flavodoxin family protein [Methanomicrobiales archaeon]
MRITVLGIAGSPRRHGNTETLLDAFLTGAGDAGALVEKVALKDLAYVPCRGCNACHRDGVCILGDDAPPLLARAMESDCLAVASPIYSMGITAELKGLIDRAQYLWARQFVIKNLKFPPGHTTRHKGVFLSTAGLPGNHVFDAAFPVITALFHDLGFEYYDNVLANGMDQYGGVRSHPTAIHNAKMKGGAVVRVLSTQLASPSEPS